MVRNQLICPGSQTDFDAVLVSNFRMEEPVGFPVAKFLPLRDQIAFSTGQGTLVVESCSGMVFWRFLIF